MHSKIEDLSRPLKSLTILYMYLLNTNKITVGLPTYSFNWV